MLVGSAAAGFVSMEEKILTAAMAGGATAKKKSDDSLKSKMPTGKLGKLNISRLISGGNLLSGWCHERDLLFVSELAAAYLTKEKQYETLELLEEYGVNTMAVDQSQLDIVNAYKDERGGKIQMICSARENWGSWEKGNLDELKTEIDKAIDLGADTLYIHGGYADRLVESGNKGNIELLGKALEYIREQGYTAGLGSHSIYVPIECSEAGVEPDYYFKTFHHDQYWSATPKEHRKKFCVDGSNNLDHNEFHDNIFCIEPEKTAEFMQKKKQPWIAFKVLAAGAIKPASGFKYCFENGVDFITVGMFDFNVAEDAVITRAILSDELSRERPWRA